MSIPVYNPARMHLTHLQFGVVYCFIAVEFFDRDPPKNH